MSNALIACPGHAGTNHWRALPTDLERACFLERVVALATDDDVVEELDAEKLAGLLQRFRDLLVGA